jgi:Carboxypeptidase regulatory-like domain
MKKAAFVAGIIFSAGVIASAQMATIVMPPVRAGSLSGVVVDPNGAIIPHASVSLISCPVGRGYPAPDNTVLKTTETDSHGEFSIKSDKFAKPYCLHLSAPGFDPLELEVKLAPSAGRMRLKMAIAN